MTESLLKMHEPHLPKPTEEETDTIINLLENILEMIPGDKIITLSISNGIFGTESFDVSKKGKVGHHHSHKGLLLASMIYALRVGGGMIIRQFLPLKVERINHKGEKIFIPKKNLYGLAFGEGIIDYMDAEDMEMAHCTHAETGEPLPKENDCYFKDSSFLAEDKREEREQEGFTQRDSDIANYLIEKIIKLIPGEKIISIDFHDEAYGCVSFDVSRKGKVGPDPNDKELLTAYTAQAVSHTGSLIITQFVPLKIEQGSSREKKIYSPKKNIYIMVFRDGKIFFLDTEEMEDVYCRDQETGKRIPKEKDVDFKVASFLILPEDYQPKR
jgi:hypothetical protein